MKRQTHSLGPRGSLPGTKSKNTQREKQQGFTIIELMVTLVVIGVILTIAVPSFVGWIQDNKLNSYTRSLVSALQLARSEAVSRHTGVTVRKGSPQTPTNWTSGFHIYTDPEGNSGFDADSDTIIKSVDFNVDGLVVETSSSGENFVSFNGSGTLNESSPVTITLCNGNGKGRLISINRVGRVSLDNAEDCDE